MPALACTYLTQNLHLPTLACTYLTLCLHCACTVPALAYTCLHLSALTLINFSGRCHELQHREVEKTFGATENSTALCTHTALAQP